MDKQVIKESGLEGIKVGLIAFLITFIVSLVFSLVVNLIWLEEINNIINGSLSVDPKLTGASLLTLTSMFLNMSLFNSGGTLASGGTLHIGVLIFALLPVIAFIIADRRDNKKESFDFHDMFIYISSSLVFAICVYVFSWITKGTFVGMSIDFSSLRNLFMTVIIAMCIQLLIGINYNKSFSPGIRLTRRLFRSLIGIGLFVGLIIIIVLLTKFLGGTISFVGILLMSVFMIPNIAVYILFTFMGASMEFGSQLHTLLYDFFGIDLGFTALPLMIRIIMIGLFFAVVLYSVFKIEKKGFAKQIFLFASSFSFLTLILSYSTRMNLGIVKNLMGVQFGYNSLYVFIMPLTVIFLAGGLVVSLENLKKEIDK